MQLHTRLGTPCSIVCFASLPCSIDKENVSILKWQTDPTDLSAPQQQRLMIQSLSSLACVQHNVHWSEQAARAYGLPDLAAGWTINRKQWRSCCTLGKAFADCPLISLVPLPLMQAPGHDKAIMLRPMLLKDLTWDLASASAAFSSLGSGKAVHKLAASLRLEPLPWVAGAAVLPF